MIFALGGCTTVQLGEKGTSRIYLGAVRVVMPDTKGQLSAIEVQSLGIGWDKGPYLGWRAGNWVIADPKECQLLIVIRSPAQADNAAKVLSALEGQDPCIVDYTHSLHR